MCKVDIAQFGKCTKAQQYGYKNAAPCIFLKLNKIFGWVPDYYNDINELPEDMPESLKKHIKSLNSTAERSQVWVSCQGEEGVDKELLGPAEYYPKQGFPSYFYPYENRRGYVSPLVAVKFLRPRGKSFEIGTKFNLKNCHFHFQSIKSLTSSAVPGPRT